MVLLIYSCGDNKKKVEYPSEEAYWQQLIKQYPDSAILKENLIQFYRDSDNYEKAIHYTDSLLQSDSGNAKLWHMKGVIDFEDEDTLEAEISFQKAYELNPNPIDAVYMARLMAYYKNPTCFKICDDILKTFGKDFEKETYLIKGNYYTATKEIEKALAYFDSSMRSSYTYMEAYIQKAILFMSLNRNEEAIDVLKKATTVQNNYDEGYYYLGSCYEKIKDTANAIDAYNKTLMINPNFIEAKEALKRLSH